MGYLIKFLIFSNDFIEVFVLVLVYG